MIKLNSISINEVCWFQFKDHLISFRFNGLPIDQHFTISFNRKTDINFHITKNTSNPKDKPTISILSIDKKLSASIIESLALEVLFNLLKPFDIHKFKKSAESDFISFYQLENDRSYREIERNIKDGFKTISKIKQKTRLKIIDKWDEKLMNFVTLNKIKKMVDGTLFKKSDNQQNIDGGILLSNDKVMFGIKIHNQWYELDTDKSLVELFSGILDKESVNLILWRIKRAIVFLKTAQSYKETELFNKPFRLIKKK